MEENKIDFLKIFSDMYRESELILKSQPFMYVFNDQKIPKYSDEQLTKLNDYLVGVLEEYPDNLGIMRTIVIILKPLQSEDIINDTWKRVLALIIQYKIKND
jgi:hypothetical protein